MSGHSRIDPGQVGPRERYDLLTSLVVPRPVGWISTRGEDGVPNLAPFSYFCAVSSSPMLVAVSVGHRASGPKDTLRNLRARGAFCHNVVDVAHLERMNASSADVPPAVDEFELSGTAMADSARVDAPYVADAPAVLECRVERFVDLGDAPNTLVLGEVVGLLIAPGLPRVPGGTALDVQALSPVARLWGPTYAPLGEPRVLPRPG